MVLLIMYFVANYIFDDIHTNCNHMNQSDWPVLMVLATLITCTFQQIKTLSPILFIPWQSSNWSVSNETLPPLIHLDRTFKKIPCSNHHTPPVKCTTTYFCCTSQFHSNCPQPSCWYMLHFPPPSSANHQTSCSINSSTWIFQVYQSLIQ